jgi:formate hydrogenlyase subunit 3/multisubunit Na+/H+ antiporter MnhD subunit
MLERLFFRYYKWALSLRLDNTPEFTSWATLSALLSFNLLALAGFFSFIKPVGGLFEKNNSPILFIIVGLIILVSIYFRYIHSGKLKVLEKKYKNESDERRKSENILAWSYIIFTFLLLYISICVKEEVYGLKN